MLSYTITAVSPASNDSCPTNLPKMKASVVTTTIDAANNVYLTNFGFDDHNHTTRTGYCDINPSTFAWRTYNTIGPVSSTAGMRLIKNRGGYYFPVGIDFTSSSSGAPLGITNTCNPPGTTLITPTPSINLSGSISLKWAVFQGVDFSDYNCSPVYVPYLVDINDFL